MSEEEKKAIEVLKNMNDGYTFKDCEICDGYNEKTCKCDIQRKKCDNLKAIETILNLIKKLKKENEDKDKGIERLKKKCEELKKQNNEKVSSFVFNRIKHNYIPKDKIREKIKELEEEAEICRKEGCENTESFDICCAEILKELLGEE